jgi:autotransporter-associated beta strand protein
MIISPVAVSRSGIRQRSLRKHCRLGRATELVFVLATGAMVSVGGAAHAQGINWTGVTDSAYGDATNWSGGVLPGANDLAIFDTATTGTVDLGGVSHTIGMITVGDPDVAAIRNGTFLFDNNFFSILTYSAGTDNVLANTLTLDLSTNALSIVANTNLSFGGTIIGTDPAQGLYLGDGSSTGILLLSGTNTYSGVTQIESGTLELSGGSAIADSGEVRLFNGSLSGLRVITAETIGSLFGVSNTSLVLDADLTLSGVANTTMAGDVSGSGGLVNSGVGTLTLTGNNAFSGGLAATGGGGFSGGVTSFGSGLIALSNASTLNLTTAGTLANAIETGAGGGTISTANALSVTLGGDITQTGDLTFGNGFDASTITIASSTVTGTGAATISSGMTVVLRSAASSNILANNGVVTGTLDMAGLNVTAAALSGTGNIASNATADATLALTGSGTFAGTIADTNNASSGVLALDVTAGAGNTYSLTGINTFTGGITVNAGTLALGAGNTLADTGAVAIATDGVLDITAGDETIGSLASAAGQGAVTLGASTLTIGGDAITEFGGVISGMGGLVVNSAGGTGNLTLTGVNSFTGDTTVMSGALTLGAGSVLAGDAIVNGGSNSGAINLLSGGITGSVSGTGIVNVVGNSSIGGASGGLVFNLNTVAGDVTDNLAITGPVSGNHVFNLDVITGSGSSNIDTITISDASMLSGTHTINMFNTGTSLQLSPEEFIIATAGTVDRNAFVIGMQPLGQLTTTEFVVTAAGNLAYTVRANAAVGGIVGSITTTSSLLETVVNRPVQPFVSSPAGQEGAGACNVGSWGRASGVTATGDSVTADAIGDNQASTDIDFGSITVGTDLGCFDARFGGWNVAAGALLSYSEGSSSSLVAAAGSAGASTTAGVFNQFTYGVYATAINGPWLVDAQLTRSSSTFTYDNVAVNLIDSDVDADSTALTVAASYLYPISDDGLLSFVPGGGFSVSQTSYSALDFGGLGSLQIADRTSTVGFASATLERTFILDGGDSISTLGATLTGYHDMSDDVASTFSIGSSDQALSTAASDTYGELSLSYRYSGILNNGVFGAGQINAQIRGDMRFGDDVQAVGVTAEIRIQF